MQCRQHPLFCDARQAPLQKIDLPCLLTDLAFPFGHPACRPAPLAQPRKCIPRTLPELTPPAL
jgi:hypothetical protein